MCDTNTNINTNMEYNTSCLFDCDEDVVVYSMFVVHARFFTVDVITTSHSIVNFPMVLQGSLIQTFQAVYRRGHEGFLKNCNVTIIDRFHGKGRERECPWQYKLENCVPLGPLC